MAVHDGVVTVDRAMMMGHSGIFADGDMCLLNAPSPRRSGTPRRSRGTSTPGCARWHTNQRTSEPACRLLNSTPEPLVLRVRLRYGRGCGTAGFDLRAEVVHGLTSSRRCSGCAAACVAATASCGTTVSASARTTCDQGGTGERFQIDRDFCKGCGVRAGVPVGLHRDAPEQADIGVLTIQQALKLLLPRHSLVFSVHS